MSQSVLTCKTNTLAVVDSLYIEAYGWYSAHCFIQLELVQYCCLTRRI